MFKAAKRTNRFNKNQKVWIEWEFGNHLHIRFKWRGNGRYVSGVIDRHNAYCTAPHPAVGTYDYKLIQIDKRFADSHRLMEFDENGKKIDNQ